MHGTKGNRDGSDLCIPCPHPSGAEPSTDPKIDSLVLTLLPCLPWTRLDSFMRAREFCLGVAACVPAARVTVCGNVLLGPPRPSLTMSKLQSTSNDQSASHSMLISSFAVSGMTRPHTALSSSINLGSYGLSHFYLCDKLRRCIETCIKAFYHIHKREGRKDCCRL